MTFIRTTLLSLTALPLVVLLGACNSSSHEDFLVETARAGYTAFENNDMEAWAQAQHSDVLWRVPVGLPYSGTYQGPQDVIDNVLTPIATLWPDFKVEPQAFYPSGNIVFVQAEITAGGQVSETIHKITILDGRYSAFEIFDDTAAMMATALTNTDADMAQPIDADMAQPITVAPSGE